MNHPCQVIEGAGIAGMPPWPWNFGLYAVGVLFCQNVLEVCIHIPPMTTSFRLTLLWCVLFSTSILVSFLGLIVSCACSLSFSRFHSCVSLSHFMTCTSRILRPAHVYRSVSSFPLVTYEALLGLRSCFILGFCGSICLCHFFPK